MVKGAVMRLGAAAARSVVGRSPQMAVPKRFMADTGVKHHPDLERWNNVRDNIDQVFDWSQPKVVVKAVIFSVLIPYALYTGVVKEGLAKNGDSSTGNILQKNTAE